MGRGSRAPRGCPETRQGGPMAGPGRIYRRGIIYYIAYRWWDGREYRESARSAHVAAAERLLATRLAERQGHARSRSLTFDALAAWYLDDYAVRRLRTLNTARGRVANLRAVFTGWQATAITSEAVRTYQRTRRGGGGDGEPGDLGAEPDAAAGGAGRPARPAAGLSRAAGRERAPAGLLRTCGVSGGPPAFAVALPGRVGLCVLLELATAGTPRDRARGMWSTRPLPFADPDTWQRLRAVIDTVGQWKASVVQIGGRLCWPLWRSVHELDEVLTCFHRRPAGARAPVRWSHCHGSRRPARAARQGTSRGASDHAT